MLLILLVFLQIAVGYTIVCCALSFGEDKFIKFTQYLEKRLGKEKAETVTAWIIIIAVIVIVTCLVVSYVKSVV